jgi:phosphomannomutase
MLTLRAEAGSQAELGALVAEVDAHLAACGVARDRQTPD